jgi:uridine phosphorylase
VVVPDAAVRDEGTSYHYLPPAREVETDPVDLAAAVSVLERSGVPHRVGKTWSTDAPYRETEARVARRRAEGCITVEMETAAFLAVARHRGVRFAQYLYAGDDLSGEAWDHRSWQTSSARRSLFDLALEAAALLPPVSSARTGAPPPGPARS